MVLDWGWSLAGSHGSGAQAATADTSGSAILAALLGGGTGGVGGGDNATAQSVGGTADNTVGGTHVNVGGSSSSGSGGGGGGGGQQQQQQQSGGTTTNGNLTDALRTGIQNGNNGNSDIWMGGSNGQTELPGQGLWNKFSQWNNTYLNTGLAPNLNGNPSASAGYGGGGGGYGGAASSNGQKAVFDARSKTWSLYDPTAKTWQDGIGQNDIYGMLTGTLKDENPEWWWGDTARNAINQEEYMNLRYANQYQGTQQGNRQQTRYSTYGL